MPDPADVAQRAYHQPDPDRIELRDVDDAEDGTFVVRMPLSSTGEARDGEAFDEDRLRGWADQIEQGTVGVFVDHGRNMSTGSRYSALGKAGYWANPELEENGGEMELMADAVMADPETLPAATGDYREMLARLKSQVERDIPLASSVGWTDETGDRDVPGGSDLLEGSIVGIPSDPRTTSHSAGVELARAALAERGDDVDREALVDQFRAVVMGPDDEQRHLSTQQAEVTEQVLNAYREEQGNGSVENFESWLWNVAYHQFDDDEFHAAQTALQEFYRETTPLEEPVDEQFLPFLDGQQSADSDGGDDGGGTDEGDDARDSVTDGDSNDSGGEPDDTNDDGSDGVDESEYRESMLEMQRQQTETLSTLADAIREDGDDDDDDDGDSDGDSDSDGDDDDDDDDDRTIEVGGEELTEDEAAERIAEMRDALDGAKPEQPDDDRDADAGDGEDESSDNRTADPKNLL